MIELVKVRPLARPPVEEEPTPEVLADDRLGRMLEEPPKAKEVERPAAKRDPHGWD